MKTASTRSPGCTRIVVWRQESIRVVTCGHGCWGSRCIGDWMNSRRGRLGVLGSTLSSKKDTSKSPKHCDDSNAAHYTPNNRTRMRRFKLEVPDPDPEPEPEDSWTLSGSRLAALVVWFPIFPLSTWTIMPLLGMS